MAKRVMSRRDFAATAATGLAALAAGCGTSSSPPASTPPPDAAQPASSPGAPPGDGVSSPYDLVFVGAFGFHKDGMPIDVYSIPDHEPVLIVQPEGEVNTDVFSKVSATTFKDLHPFFEGKTDDWYVMCLNGWTLWAGLSGQADWGGQVQWQDMKALAKEANNNKDYRFAAPSQRYAALWDGQCHPAPRTRALGHDKEWTFKVGQNEYGNKRRRLTDIATFRRHGSPQNFEVRELTGNMRVLRLQPKRGTSAWVVALYSGLTEDTTPHILEHGEHYFDFFKADGQAPTVRPIAETARFEPQKKDKIIVPCVSAQGQSLLRYSPPDTEFCYQARL